MYPGFPICGSSFDHRDTTGSADLGSVIGIKQRENWTMQQVRVSLPSSKLELPDDAKASRILQECGMSSG